MEELKPCPFCPDGGKPEFKDGWQREDGHFYHGYVKCAKCGTVQLSHSLSDYLGTIRHGFVSDEVIHNCSLTAIQFWNTRHELTCKNISAHGTNIAYSTVKEDFVFKCSECFCELLSDDLGNSPLYDINCEHIAINYCPNCGSRVG